MKEMEELQAIEEKYIDHQALHRNEITKEIEGFDDHSRAQTIDWPQQSNPLTSAGIQNDGRARRRVGKDRSRTKVSSLSTGSYDRAVDKSPNTQLQPPMFPA